MVAGVLALVFPRLFFAAQRFKSFLVLFCKKEPLASF